MSIIISEKTKNFPIEFNDTKFYHFYYGGVKIDLFDQTIIASSKSFKKDNNKFYRVFFYCEEQNIVVEMTLYSKSEFYKGNRSGVLTKESLISDYQWDDNLECFPIEAPQLFLSFLKQNENSFVPVVKRVCSKYNLDTLIEQYEELLNRPLSYITYKELNTFYLKKYSDLFKICSNTNYSEKER